LYERELHKSYLQANAMLSRDQNSTPCDQDHLRKSKLNETPIIVQILLTFLYNFYSPGYAAVS